jgi:hypothetical protein
MAKWVGIAFRAEAFGVGTCFRGTESSAPAREPCIHVPRHVNLAFTTRCIDAFLDNSGELQGCELKASGNDGVCGLTLNEERLLRLRHVRVFFVNPVRGLIGEADTQALLNVPRRIDGIPVGQARVEWAAAA